jgi:hypothetical protein
MTVGPSRTDAKESAAARSCSVLTVAASAPSACAARAYETGPKSTASAPPWPAGRCLILIRLRVPSLNTTTAMRSLSRAAVSISASVMPRPPSPVNATTSRAGAHNAAAMAAGSANPIVARPLEIISRRGSVTSHNGMTASM